MRARISSRRVGLAATTVHLREPGDAGPHLVPQHVALDELAVFLVVRDRMRARTHQAHVAEHDVHQLGQLVDRITAQYAAQRA